MGKQTCDITIFHLDGKRYNKKVYHGCYWEDDQSANIKKSGLSNVDSLYISVPWIDSGLNIAKGKDLAIKGLTDLEIDNSSEFTQSTSIKELKASHDVYTISSMSEKCHGSRKLWHWELSGK